MSTQQCKLIFPDRGQWVRRLLALYRVGSTQLVDDNGFSLIQLFDVAIALHLTGSTCMLQTSISSRGVERVAGLPIAVRRLLLCLVVTLKQDCSKKLQKASIGRWRAIPDPDHARAATCYKARAVTCYGARVVTCYGAKVVTGYGARIVTCDGAKAFTCYGARPVTCYGARSFTCSTPSVPRSCRGGTERVFKSSLARRECNTGFRRQPRQLGMRKLISKVALPTQGPT